MTKSKKSAPSGWDQMIGDLLEMIIVGIGYLLLFNAKVIWRGIKEVGTWKILLDQILTMALASYFIVRFQWHLDILHWFFPQVFNNGLVAKIHQLGAYKNFFAVTAVLTSSWLWWRGVLPFILSWRYQEKLDSIGLKNAAGSTPKIVQVKTLDTHRKSLKVMVAGIGIERVKAKRDELQAAFAKEIEEIKRLKNPRYVQIILSTRFMPEHVCFGDHQENLTQDGHFLVGESKRGIVMENIAKLPHILIAGHTGGGKSQFFKQLLVGLLKSSDHLQMHLIDLKGGLEFKDFGPLPNVKMAKTMESSVSILRKVKKEMQARFSYLEQKGLQRMEPQRHPFDRIIVGIDEASVLYAQARKDSEDYDLVCEARSLTESIAKLGRAASIHLILATQKVSKESIDTRIQENIAGRMCFKTGTPEGSIRVLGNAKASHLSATPGRGIWQFGNDELEVQTPYLSTNEMGHILQDINDDYTSGSKTMQQNFEQTDGPISSLPLINKNLSKEEFLNE